MNAEKLIVRALTPVIALLFFHMGYEQATGSPAQLEDIILTELEGRTQLSVLLDEEVKYRLKYNKESNEISFRFPDASMPETFTALEYTDDLIESIKVYFDKESSDSVINLKFKQPGVTFHRSGDSESPQLTMEFRNSSKAIKVTGYTPKTLLERFKSKPREEEPEVEKTEEEALADLEKMAEETTAPEVKKGPTPEELAARFADTDKKYDDLETISGRDEYIELMKLMRVGKVEELKKAATMANDFVKKYPKSAYIERVYFTRSDAYYRLSKKDQKFVTEALATYNDAIARFPDSHLVEQAMIRKGDMSRQQEFMLEALTEYGGLINHYPKSKYFVQAMLKRADIFIDQRKYSKAYNELEKILVLFPTHRAVQDVKYLIAESYYDRSKFDIAGKIFEEALKLWPTFPKTHPRTFLKIADTMYRTDAKEKALEMWLSIINLFPMSMEGRQSTLRVADLYIERKQRGKAAKLLEALIRRFPKSDRAALATLRLASLGAQYPHLLKNSAVFDYAAFKSPIKTFDEIYKKDPKKFGVDSLLRKGKALRAQKRYLASIVAYKELLRLYPSTRMSDQVFELVRENFLRLIEMYHSQDGFFMALLTYYNNFDPFLRSITEPDILVTIADSYNAMTLYDRAIDYYQLADSLDKEGEFKEKTAFNIAVAALKSGHNDTSTLMFTDFLKRFPKGEHSLSARHLLGNALYKKGKTAEAATEWRLAMELDPSSPLNSKTAYTLGRLYKKQGAYTLAIDAFYKALDTYNPELKTDVTPDYLKDSYYNIADSYYMDENYPVAIREARNFKEDFSDDSRLSWMDYIISASLEKTNREDMAEVKLKELSEKDDRAIIGRVASAKLKTFKWKKENPDLFTY